MAALNSDSSYTFDYISFFLYRFITSEFIERVLEHIPDAYGQRQGTPQKDSPAQIFNIFRLHFTTVK